MEKFVRFLGLQALNFQTCWRVSIIDNANARVLEMLSELEKHDHTTLRKTIIIGKGDQSLAHKTQECPWFSMIASSSLPIRRYHVTIFFAFVRVLISY